MLSKEFKNGIYSRNVGHGNGNQGESGYLIGIYKVKSNSNLVAVTLFNNGIQNLPECRLYGINNGRSA